MVCANTVGQNSEVSAEQSAAPESGDSMTTAVRTAEVPSLTDNAIGDRGVVPSQSDEPILSGRELAQLPIEQQHQALYKLAVELVADKELFGGGHARFMKQRLAECCEKYQFDPIQRQALIRTVTQIEAEYSRTAKLENRRTKAEERLEQAKILKIEDEARQLKHQSRIASLQRWGESVSTAIDSALSGPRTALKALIETCSEMAEIGAESMGKTIDHLSPALARSLEDLLKRGGSGVGSAVQDVSKGALHGLGEGGQQFLRGNLTGLGQGGQQLMKGVGGGGREMLGGLGEGVGRGAGGAVGGAVGNLISAFKRGLAGGG